MGVGVVGVEKRALHSFGIGFFDILPIHLSIVFSGSFFHILLLFDHAVFSTHLNIHFYNFHAHLLISYILLHL